MTMMWEKNCVLIVFVFQIICDEGSLANQNRDQNLQVITNSGIVQGRRDVTAEGFPYWAYQGIPFAKPPIGNLRFRSPVPNDPWKGVLDATKEKSGCMETYIDGASGIGMWGDEDCLYINVYSSRDPKFVKKKLPVLVWIYGGAFAHGNSSSKFYGIDHLIEQDMVLVTFNYRVGILGFMSTGDLASPGNYGLKDQVLALRWIQKNINYFGGDKNRVTIFGQSAGAASVMYQMLSSSSTGLFHRAIANSGSPLCLWAYSREAKTIAFDVALAAGIKSKNTKEIVNHLRKISRSEIRRISKLITLVSLPKLDKNGFGFGPVVEPPHKEAFLTDIPYEKFESGKFNKVPLIMAMNTLETALFSDAITLLRPIIFRYDLSPGSIPNPSMNINSPQKSTEVGHKIKETYFENTIVDSSQEELLRYTTDDQFFRPLTKTAQLIYKHIPLYYYIFSYSSIYGVDSLKTVIKNRPPIAGVSHLEEQWYIWRKRGLELHGQDKVISMRLLRLIRNFMEFGNPTPAQEASLQYLTWPRVTSARNLTQLLIDYDFSLTQNYRWKYMQFWDKLYQQYGHKPYLTY